MSKKNKIYIAVFVCIGLAYAFTFDFSSITKLFSSNSKSQKTEINNLKRKKQKLLFDKLQEKDKKKIALSNAKYFWSTSKRKITDTLIHSEINRAASRASLSIRSISRTTFSDISDNIKQGRVTITISCSMREAAKLLNEFDKIRPKFFWKTCSIRPYNTSRYSKNTSTVLISGSLVTYILDKNASKAIEGGKK